MFKPAYIDAIEGASVFGVLSYMLLASFLFLYSVM